MESTCTAMGQATCGAVSRGKIARHVAETNMKGASGRLVRLTPHTLTLSLLLFLFLSLSLTVTREMHPKKQHTCDTASALPLPMPSHGRCSRLATALGTLKLAATVSESRSAKRAWPEAETVRCQIRWAKGRKWSAKRGRCGAAEVGG